MRMRSDQRQQIHNFEKATLPQHCMPSSSRSSTTESSGETVHAAAAGHQCLSITAEDSGITTIPLVTLDGMWSNAEQILNSDNAITHAPGSNKKACMVISCSQAGPHRVQTRSDGQYDCDSACLQWASSHICSHTIAVVEYNKELDSFLHWFVKYAESPNISVLVMSGLPHGHGKKRGKPKRQRKRQLMPPADSQSLRPGLQRMKLGW